MDPTTAVRSETLPVIATVVAPGAFVSGPYLWAGLATADAVRAFLDRHEGLALAGAILLWIVAGFTVESLGSYVEFYWIDRPRPDRAEMLETWWRYLRIAWSKEPVGQHYLRRMLVSFKFELNMSVAAALTIPGVVILGMRGAIGGGAAAVTIAILAVAAAGLFGMAQTSAGVLADVREQLVRGVSI